ncbi:CS1 type fimbrial major subunit (plasmid) [Pantoea agglomerans]|nr:CS1 type fimbrial major subunit [Pantoea agglomerans]WIL44521.1 CS1 type fimbrial major subunit [Pantoea agglomerans]
MTVNADVDATAGLTLADGTALLGSVSMTYSPRNGLSAYKNNVKLWTNAQFDMNVSLVAAPQLTDISGANAISLTVSLGDKKLTTTSTTFNYSTLFPRGTDNGSAALPLVIQQTTPSTTVSVYL